LRRPRSGRFVLYLVAGIVLVIGLLQVNQFSRLTSTGYEIEALKRERDLKLAANHRIEAEVASLSSLARVEWVARTQMGMEPAGRVLYIDVNQPLPDRQSLPTRYLPAAEEPVEPAESDGAPWWKRPIDWVVPF
jgi:cell division protein FtsL